MDKPIHRIKLAIVWGATLALVFLVCMHVDGINGPTYWRWPWRAGRGALPYVLMGCASIPYWLALIRYAPPRKSIAFGLILLMTGTFLSEMAQRIGDTVNVRATEDAGDKAIPASMARVVSIISDPGTTGYFTHAQEYIASGRSLRAFLRDYASRLSSYTLHARNKPPGSILFYVPFLRGSPTPEAAAMWAGLTVALLATLSVPGTFLFIREFTGDSPAALWGAGCMAMAPGLVLFMPEFDQVYPAVATAMAILWHRALQRGGRWHAAVFGAVLAGACFVTFNLLVLGVFLGMLTLVYVWHGGRKAFSDAAVQGALALGTVFVLYFLLWMWCGYNPIETLRAGIRNHAQDMPATHRYWPHTIPFDLADYALGAGWGCALLAMFWLFRRDTGGLGWVVILSMIEPVAAALAGVLQGETARVWLFLFPFLMVGAGLELSRWERGARLGVLAALWLVMVVLGQNMVFV